MEEGNIDLIKHELNYPEQTFNKLKEISNEVERRLEIAKSLAVTEDNYKELKKVRAQLNKEFEEHEEHRKEVKELALGPYMIFDANYKMLISDKYKEMDEILKKQIDSWDNMIKEKKESFARNFFKEFSQTLHVDKFVKYEDMNLKILLSDSDNKITTKITDFLTKARDEIEIIAQEEHHEEILAEYLTCFDFAKAKMTVLKRIKREQEINEHLQNLTEEIVNEIRTVETVDKIVDNEVKIVIEPQIYKCVFTVTATKEELVGIKEYMNEHKIKFEGIRG